MATPAVVPQARNLIGLDWRTIARGGIERKRRFRAAG